jgi:hypothetical protein
MDRQDFLDKNLIAKGCKVLYREDMARGGIFVVYINNEILVLEKRYSFLRKLGEPGCLFVPPFVLLPFLFILVFLYGKEYSSILLIAGIWSLSSLLLSIVLSVFLSKLPVDTVDRVVIDSRTKKVFLEREKKGKVKVKKNYSTSLIKNVRVVVDSYYRMNIYLVSTTKSIYVVGYNEISDNGKKLEIAHKIAGLLGVPVIEKT